MLGFSTFFVQQHSNDDNSTDCVQGKNIGRKSITSIGLKFFGGSSFSLKFTVFTAHIVFILVISQGNGLVVYRPLYVCNIYFLYGFVTRQMLYQTHYNRNFMCKALFKMRYGVQINSKINKCMSHDNKYKRKLQGALQNKSVMIIK